MIEEKEGLLAWYKSLSEQRHKEIVGRDATIKQLQEENNQLISQEAILIEENLRLKEALKTCIDDLMYVSTAGHLLMWAQRDRAVPERLLEIRKLVYP